MSAGTLTLTNNSAAVKGSGTAFNNELVAGDFIVVTVGGVTYTLPVKTIETGTALTLARNYNGPTVSAGAWTAMPRDTLNRISAQIAADTAYAIRQRVLEIDNWYQLLEVNGDVTIKMADGSSYTGPSWLSVVSRTGNLSALGIGGTGTALAALDWQTFDFVPGARYFVRTDAMTNVPAGVVLPSNTALQCIINVVGYEVSVTRHVELWFSTSTINDYRKYDIRTSGNPGSRSFKARQIWTSDDVIPLANTAIGEIGLGIDVTPVITSIDWQQIEFKTGQSVRVSASNMTNVPVGLAYTAGTGLIITAIGKTSATRTSVQIVPDTVGGANYTITEVLLVGAPGARSFYTRNVLAFSDDDSGKLLGRQRLGLNDLGFGIQQPVTTNFDWQTTLMQSGQSWLLDASNMVNAPTELPNSGRLVAKVAGMSSAYAMLDVYEQPLSGAATGRRWYVYVGTYATAGSRGFTVRPLLTKADLDTRVGYALLAPAGNITTSQRVVLTNPFGMGTPVLCYIEIFVNNVWMSPGMIFNPSTGSFGTTASFKGDEGIIVQAGSYRIGCDPLSGGSNGGSAGIGLNNTTTAPYRVHVFKVTA
ncbi:hypothetical protein [Kluyvera huaxiensis]|uniref:hypothetical protein n=1 Tax=Kluyvera sp. 142053 TaxID=3160979 RepID=UPI0032DF4373